MTFSRRPGPPPQSAATDGDGLPPHTFAIVTFHPRVGGPDSPPSSGSWSKSTAVSGVIRENPMRTANLLLHTGVL